MLVIVLLVVLIALMSASLVVQVKAMRVEHDPQSIVVVQEQRHADPATRPRVEVDLSFVDQSSRRATIERAKQRHVERGNRPTLVSDSPRASAGIPEPLLPEWPPEWTE